MARAATTDEKAKFRSSGQWSRLYLAIEPPAAVFKARINQTFSSYDGIAQLTYDTVTEGAYTDVLPGMTCYVGSSEGAYDRGMVRVRKDPTSSVLYIGETSAIEFEDNDYLTVVEEFSIWPRHIYLDGTTPKIDYDIEYSDQHEDCDPVPVLGPDIVVWLTGASVDVEPDASDSWVIGSTISSYSWSAPDASATADLDTATPTITYDTAGVYRIACTVTAANSKTKTGYRYVYVYSSNSMPTTQFTLEECSGDREKGGWSFTVLMHDEAALTEVRDRQKVILFSKDYYAGTNAEIGPVDGRENIWTIGWIDGDSIELVSDPVGVSRVRFTVQGPQFWINKITGFPTGLEDTDFADNGGGAPNRWTEFQNLTVDKGLWHFLDKRTTSTLCADFYKSGDTRELATIEAPVGTLWTQLLAFTDLTIMARPQCNRYGQLYCEIDSQYIPEADRSSIPVIMDIEKQDLGSLAISRREVDDTCMVEISGTVYGSGDAIPLGARSPGEIFMTYGAVEQITELALESQSDTNTLAGLIAGQRNAEYPEVEFSLAENNRLIDIAPLQYITMSLSASDTERGVTWTTKKFIPRRVTFEFSPESHFLKVLVAGECETFPLPAVTMDFPGSTGGDPPPGFDPIEPIEPPIPPTPPTVDDFLDGQVLVATSSEVRVCTDFGAITPEWQDKTGTISGTIVDACQDTTDATGNTVYVATSTAVYKTTNLLDETPTWTSIYDADTEHSGEDPQIKRVVLSPASGSNVYILLAARETSGSSTAQAIVAYSTDGGSSFEETVVTDKDDAVKDYTVEYQSKSAGMQSDNGNSSWEYEDAATMTFNRVGDDDVAANPIAFAWRSSGGYTPPGGSIESYCVLVIGSPGDENDIINYSTLTTLQNELRPQTHGNSLYGSHAECKVVLTDYFGVDGTDYLYNTGFYTPCPKEANRTDMRWRIGARIDHVDYDYTYEGWVFWNTPSISMAVSMAVGLQNPNAVYVGCEDGVYRSVDNGQTFELLIPDYIAYDIECYLPQSSHDPQTKCFMSDGGAYTTWNASLLGGSWHVEGSALEQHGRIASDPENSWPTFLLSHNGSEDFDLVRYADALEETRLTGLTGARSLRQFVGDETDDRILYWLESDDIYYSDDGGATKTDRKGSWSGYSSPVVIFPLT